MTGTSGTPDRTAEKPTGRVIVLRPFATPIPIGMMALAVGSIVLSGDQLFWYPASQGHEAALCLLAFVVPLQFISFLFALLSGDEGASSVMAMLAGSWFAISLVSLTQPDGTTSSALGVLLAAAGAVLLLPAVAASTGKPLIGIVVGIAASRFMLAAGYELSGSHSADRAAGWLGVLLSALAVYAAAAFAFEAVDGRPVIPVLRRAPRDAVDLGEPGVRRKL